MKRKHSPETSNSSRREVMISAWRSLGEASIGAEELRTIQTAVAEAFGEDEVDSPARIAAELVKQGAELRHPEVIEYDARWRKSRIELEMKRFERLTFWRARDALTLDEARTAITEIEELRVRFLGSENDIDNLTEVARDARETAMKNAVDNSLALAVREVQNEIAEWLRLWLETPDLFPQWLELRQASAQFKAKFVDN
ncbi:MAG TPA: hypothetical protein VE863_13035 [Pyrinomonadaceae bacterium]|jgi:hypothetical protein|nr:hypothetical protein [Pyrinomonadaceae bacterium]